MARKELLKAMNAHKFRVHKYTIDVLSRTNEHSKTLLDKTMSPKEMLAYIKKNVLDEVIIMERIYNDLFVDGKTVFGTIDNNRMCEIDVTWA